MQQDDRRYRDVPGALAVTVYYCREKEREDAQEEQDHVRLVFLSFTFIFCLLQAASPLLNFSMLPRIGIISQ